MNTVASSGANHNQIWTDLTSARYDYFKKHKKQGLKCSKKDVSMNITEQLDFFSNKSQNSLLNISVETFKTGGKMFIYLIYCSEKIEHFKENLKKIIYAGPFSKSLVTALKVAQKWQVIISNHFVLSQCG